MAQQQNSTEATRRPYRILRGQYSRREGPPVVHIDPETNQPTRRKSRPFVHYSARTKDNADAKDEIMLTDAEARAYGMGRLKRLTQRDISTADEPGDSSPMPAAELESRPKVDIVASLIKIGEGVHGIRAIGEWKRSVMDARVLSGPLPKTRDEVLETLRAIEAELDGQPETGPSINN